MAENKLEQVSVRLVEQPPLYSREPIDNPLAVVRIMREFLAQMDRELFCIVNVQSDLKPINMNVVSAGTLNQSLVHPREVFKTAILSNAAGIMLIHNHPSGNLEPSKEDIAVTDRMQKAGRLLGIQVFDHVITGREMEFFSFREHRMVQEGYLNYADNLDEIRFEDGLAAEQGIYSIRSGESQVGEPQPSITSPLPFTGKDMDSILKSLETGVKELFTSERYQNYLKTMSHFHNYSFNNTLLIAMQRPDATLVTGYRSWQSMGRQVRKGEKGITIIAPTPIRKITSQEILDQHHQPVLNENGEPKTEEVEITIPRFKAITVFDITQTVGNPIDLMAPEELKESFRDYDLFMRAVTEISPVPIRFDEIKGNAKGYYHNVDKEIVIQEGMSESQTMKTAIHESGHARLHDRDQMKSQGEVKDRLTQEVEAESVAYCVCSAFGLDTSDYSFPYIAGWSSGKDMKELRASMDLIRSTAGSMIEDLTEKIRELQAEKHVEIEAGQLKEQGGHSFYVAECADYPVMGESHENLSLDEAIRIYERMPSGRFQGGKGIGFDLQDGSDYAGKYILIKEDKVDRGVLARIPQSSAYPVIQDAVKRLEDYAKNHSKPLIVDADRPIRLYREGQRPVTDQRYHGNRGGAVLGKLNVKQEAVNTVGEKHAQSKNNRGKGGMEIE